MNSARAVPLLWGERPIFVMRIKTKWIDNEQITIECKDWAHAARKIRQVWFARHLIRGERLLRRFLYGPIEQNSGPDTFPYVRTNRAMAKGGSKS